MTPKTKAFMKELSDLLCKYDAELRPRLTYGDDIEVRLYMENNKCLDLDEITWQEIDRMLEDAE